MCKHMIIVEEVKNSLTSHRELDEYEAKRRYFKLKTKQYCRKIFGFSRTWLNFHMNPKSQAASDR
jgi:hypothetical protein